AASLASLPPRNDNVYGYLTPLCLTLVIARAESPWRSTVHQQAKRPLVRVTRDTMDRRVVHIVLLAMTILVTKVVKFHCKC
ncbi:hypothetical protein N9N13_08050, partial [Opitutales bacterium]|nr:hypothetical protein [Opitutales bacterium]